MTEHVKDISDVLELVHGGPLPATLANLALDAGDYMSAINHHRGKSTVFDAATMAVCLYVVWKRGAGR